MQIAAATSIARPSLHDEVVGRLRELIVHGDLLPGERIGERALCERFGISRTPLREALKVLAVEGLIELLPHRGARVARLTRSDVQHMFEVMAALEALSGSLAATRITDEELAEMTAVHERMTRAYEERALRAYFDCNQEIHERIVAAARNPVLRDTYAGLNGRVRRSRYAANLSEERWAQAMHEHDAMLAALHARDATRLAALLHEHLEHKGEVVLRELAEDVPAQP